MKRELVGRWLLTSDGLREGYLRLEDGVIQEVCIGSAPIESISSLIIPSFVNSHTHLGDSVGYPAPKGSVQEIVGPPDGYKHKVLSSSSSSKKMAAMRSALGMMISSGTSLFGDFREEGLDGVRSLKAAHGENSIGLKIFGRPESADPDSPEIDRLLAECDGIGMSALSDWDYDLLKALSNRSRASRKMFALHASERMREDIGKIIDLKPAFVVHMCKASDEDIVTCAESGVPVVVCPRSNRFFGLNPDVPRLLRLGATVSIGTDNGMIARPDMLEEANACFTMSADRGGVTPEDVVRLATSNGRKVLNAEAQITTEITEKSDLVAIKVRGDDPLRGLVTEARIGDVLGIARGGMFGRKSAWMR